MHLFRSGSFVETEMVIGYNLLLSIKCWPLNGSGRQRCGADHLKVDNIWMSRFLLNGKHG